MNQPVLWPILYFVKKGFDSIPFKGAAAFTIVAASLFSTISYCETNDPCQNRILQSLRQLFPSTKRAESELIQELAKYETLAMDSGRREQDHSGHVTYFKTYNRNEINFNKETGKFSFKSQVPLIDGVYYYFMDKTGKIYAARVNDDPGILMHHSSLPAGGDVAAVGNLEFRDGKISSIDPCSGHYRPPLKFFSQVLSELRERGADLNSIKREPKCN